MRILDFFRSGRPDISSLLSEEDFSLVENEPSVDNRFPQPSEPIFKNTKPLNAYPYFSLLTRGNYNDQGVIRVFFDMNPTPVPHIGFMLRKPGQGSNHISYDNGEKDFRGFGNVDGYAGEDIVASKAFIAYIMDGNLHLSEVVYQKANTTREADLMSSYNKAQKELIRVLVDNKDKFLAENSGIPEDYVKNYIKPVYDKLESVVQCYKPEPSQKIAS